MPVPMVPSAVVMFPENVTKATPITTATTPNQDGVLKRGHGLVGPEKAAEPL